MNHFGCGCGGLGVGRGIAWLGIISFLLIYRPKCLPSR